MRSVTTCLAAGIMSTALGAVAVTLTTETSQGVWNEDLDSVPDVASEECIGQFAGGERQNQKTRVASLSITEGGEATDVRHTFRAETGQDLVFGHMTQFWSKNCSLAGIACVVEGHRHLLFAKLGAFQEGLCLSTCFRFHDERAVGRGFNFQSLGATDHAKIFSRPKNIDFPERDSFILWFYDHVRPTRLHERLGGSYRRAGGGQVRARSIAGGGGLGRISGGRGRARVRARAGGL